MGPIFMIYVPLFATGRSHSMLRCCYTKYPPKVATKSLALLLRIREVPSSNFGPYTG
jgi:hypothetical protein